MYYHFSGFYQTCILLHFASIYLPICVCFYLLCVFLSIMRISIYHVHFYLSIYLSMCVSVYLSCAFLSNYHVRFYLSIMCVSIYVCAFLSMYVRFYLSMCVSIYVSMCVSIYLSICISIWSIYLNTGCKKNCNICAIRPTLSHFDAALAAQMSRLLPWKSDAAPQPTVSG